MTETLKRGDRMLAARPGPAGETDGTRRTCRARLDVLALPLANSNGRPFADVEVTALDEPGALRVRAPLPLTQGCSHTSRHAHRC
jgi:hypothetical protein